MQLIIDERVERVLRYLAPEEAKRARRAFDLLKHQDPEENQRRFPKLPSPVGSEPFFLLRVTPRLRAIFRYSDDKNAVVIEDLVSRDTLTRHFRRVER